MVFPFQARGGQSKYDSVIVCAVQPLKTQRDQGSLPRMVICIDLVKDDFRLVKKQKEFALQIFLYFTTLVAVASSSMRVNDDELYASVNPSA